MNDANLKPRVESRLGEQGYPLEFASASAFRKGGFRVFQGYHVEDANETRLELDVLAQDTLPMDTGSARVPAH